MKKVYSVNACLIWLISFAVSRQGMFMVCTETARCDLTEQDQGIGFVFLRRCYPSKCIFLALGDAIEQNEYGENSSVVDFTSKTSDSGFFFYIETKRKQSSSNLLPSFHATNIVASISEVRNSIV